MNAIAPEHMHEFAGSHRPATFSFDGFTATHDHRASQAASALLDPVGNQQNQYSNINAGQCRVEGAQERHPKEEKRQTQKHRNRNHDYPKLVVTNERPQSHDRSDKSVNRAAQSSDVVFTPSNCAFFAALFLLSFAVVFRWDFIKGLIASLF